MKHRIILVPFPFDDFTGTKVRPAICLTDRIGVYNHVVIAFITSQVAKANELTDILLQSSDNDFSKTGLKVSSAIRLHRLVTIPTHIIKRQLGELPPFYQHDVERRLRQLFGI